MKYLHHTKVSLKTYLQFEVNTIVKKTISLKEAEEILKAEYEKQKNPDIIDEKKESKKPKKSVKTPEKKKKIRKK